MRAKSEDPFTVAVTAGKLIVGRKKFPQFARCFYDKMGQFSVEFSYWIRGSTTTCSASSTRFQHKIVGGRNFLLASWCLIAKISASQKFPAIRYVVQENLPLSVLLLSHHFLTTARQSLNVPSCMHTVKVSFPIHIEKCRGMHNVYMSIVESRVTYFR